MSHGMPKMVGTPYFSLCNYTGYFQYLLRLHKSVKPSGHILFNMQQAPKLLVHKMRTCGTFPFWESASVHILNHIINCSRSERPLLNQWLNRFAESSLLDRIREYKPDSLIIVNPRFGISKVAICDL